ncbi:FAD-dependent monooxygenase [Amycolatopsis balhimycina DSM 5908]|uniref:FAD-dependent monooxygenase n=1 Tax=Amycolatopsis balhimycina DSM 5908 TaxID=1081091 RepID=A0A428WPF6_AMYBA|nr:FAD-dependent monooxygenase [Amycolatopsis balhimycina DSM 5908]
MRVIVAGAGIGGLCLAQGLRQAGIEVTVYEQDPAAFARGQGYRLRIDRHGTAALRDCLPPDSFARYEQTANPPYESIGAVYDHHLEVRYQHAQRSTTWDPANAARGVNRLTLREVLLGGLADVVRFDARVTGFDLRPGGVRVRLDGGGTDSADLLVGADGLGSAVRRGLVPEAEVLDTGLRAIYGMTPLDDALLAALPPALFGGSCPVQGPERRTLALGSYQPVRSPAEFDLTPVPDYMKWTLVAPMATYSMTEPEFWSAAPERLLTEALRCVADWHPALVDLVHRSDPAVTFPLAIRAAAQLPELPAVPVTLIGDAIHATTPVGGTGANTALRDAALLRHHLDSADGLVDALTTYQAEMRDYGAAAARNSLRGAETIFRCDPLPI